MDQVPTVRVAEYSGEDADLAWRLGALLEAELSWEGRTRTRPPLRKVYHELEVPLIEVLAELEQTVSASTCRSGAVRRGDARSCRRSSRRFTASPGPFSIGSPPSCARCCSRS